MSITRKDCVIIGKFTGQFFNQPLNITSAVPLGYLPVGVSVYNQCSVLLSGRLSIPAVAVDLIVMNGNIYNQRWSESFMSEDNGLSLMYEYIFANPSVQYTFSYPDHQPVPNTNTILLLMGLASETIYKRVYSIPVSFPSVVTLNSTQSALLSGTAKKEDLQYTDSANKTWELMDLITANLPFRYSD